MKRETIKAKKYFVKKINPYFFWKHCEVCDKDFKKEPGFEITIPLRRDQGSSVHIVCCSCVDDGEKYAEQLTKPIKVLVPPPPPRVQPYIKFPQ